MTTRDDLNRRLAAIPTAPIKAPEPRKVHRPAWQRDPKITKRSKTKAKT